MSLVLKLKLAHAYFMYITETIFEKKEGKQTSCYF